MPAPHSPLDPAGRPSPQQIRRIDDEEREQHRDEHVAGDSHRRREQAEQREIGAHAADVNREQRDDERQRPAAIDRRPRSFGSLDFCGHRRRPRLVCQPELADDRFGSAVVYTGATMMLQVMPKIRSAPAIATTHVKSHPRASRISTTTDDVAERGPGRDRAFPLVPGCERC